MSGLANLLTAMEHLKKQTGKIYQSVSDSSRKTGVVLASALSMGLMSCDWHPMTVSFTKGAQGDYELGRTDKAIEANNNEIITLKTRYNALADEYVQLKVQQVDHLGRCDRLASARTYNRMQELDKQLQQLSEEIQEKEALALDLQTYFDRGKEKSQQNTPVQNATHKKYKVKKTDPDCTTSPLPREE